MKVPVLVVIHYARSGITSIVTSQIMGGDRDSFDFTVLLFQKDEAMERTLEVGGIRVCCIPVHGFTNLPGAITKFIRLIRTIKPAIVHTHSFLPRLFTRACMNIMRNPGFRHVTTFHCDYPYLHNSAIRDRCKRLLEKWALPSVTRVTFNSQFAREKISSVYPFDSGQTTVIYNGVAAGGRQTERNIISSDQPRGCLNVLSVGRFSQEKNFGILIGCWKRVLAVFPFACLTILGDGEEKNKLENAVVKEGLGDSVRLPGWKDDITPFMNEADIFILPSFYESLPMSILEAGLYSLPVIATNVGGIPEIIRNGYNGTLLPAGDRCALENEILSLMANPAKRAEYGKKLRNTILEKFAIDIHVDEMQSLYRQVLSEKRGLVDLTQGHKQ